MQKVKLTQGKVALIDTEDIEPVSLHKWSFDPKGYAFTNIGKRPNRRILYMHRFIMDAPKGKECDHINGNKLDNRRSNLRICSRIENSRNRKVYKNSTGFKGVSFNKRDKLYYSHVMENGKSVYAGCSKVPEVAAVLYNKLAVKLHGEFASLNAI